MIWLIALDQETVHVCNAGAQNLKYYFYFQFMSMTYNFPFSNKYVEKFRKLKLVSRNLNLQNQSIKNVSGNVKKLPFHDYKVREIRT